MSEDHEAARRDEVAFLIHLNREIRNSLHSIINAAELLLHTSLDDERREYVEIVLLAADDLRCIVDDISTS